MLRSTRAIVASLNSPSSRMGCFGVEPVVGTTNCRRARFDGRSDVKAGPRSAPCPRNHLVLSVQLPAPRQIVHHILRFGCTIGIAVVGQHPKPQIVTRRHRKKGSTTPPADRCSSASLAGGREPQRWTAGDGEDDADHLGAPPIGGWRRLETGISANMKRTGATYPLKSLGRGSFGSPSTISPMMLRWIWDEPA